MSYVEPIIEMVAVICPTCRVRMRAEVGKAIDDPTRLLWYRCTFDPTHVSRALPLPNVNVAGLFPRRAV